MTTPLNLRGVGAGPEPADAVGATDGVYRGSPSQRPSGVSGTPGGRAQPALITAGRPVLVHDYRGDWIGWTRMVPDVGTEPCHVACIDPLYSARRIHAVYRVPWRALAQP